jgi:hypothetical protein
MNIFILDKDPEKAAKMQCDKHIVKMVLETAQILCTLFPDGYAPYKRTHYNHPCSIWARKSFDNYRWLVIHGLSLCEEYTKRFKKVHKSQSIIQWCCERKQNYLPEKSELTPFVQAMPEQYRNEDPVKAYRDYYLNEKKSFAKWDKGTPAPEWWTIKS